ncbi:putative DNA-binding domain-containing protein [Thioclava sp.]|uniref:HvfC/BufC family peptide modification chaperone n=1 Tax=Thioclava sp. TaxID=1933450 RepID=UPI003AA96AD0
MSSHLEFAHNFQIALSGDQLPVGAQADDPSDITQRFNVYRNNVAYELAQALSRQFPATQRLVGAECFAGVAQMFIAQHPPTQPDTYRLVHRVSAVLAALGSLSSLPYLSDVARIEWARSRAYQAANASPVKATQLNTLARHHRMHLHPSVQN